MTVDETGFLLPSILLGEDWKGLELAVLRLLAHLGWTGLQYVGQSGDMGADILGTRYDPTSRRERSYLFQVKAVSGVHATVSHPAIDQALSAQAFYGANTVVVVTNGEFTRSAIERVARLNATNNNVQLWNGATLLAAMRRCPAESTDRKTPFAYQQNVVDAICQAYLDGKKSAFYVVATGLGKTVIAAEVTRRLYHRHGLKRVLVLCHSEALAIQLQKSFWCQLDKTIPTLLFRGGARPRPIEGINFGLYQSLYSNLGGFEGDEFDLVVVDEAHHALANSFALCLNHLKPKFLIGMTATPWRGDGFDVSSVFGKPLAQVSLIQGMRMGRIASVDYRIMCDNINWKEVEKAAGQKISIRDLNKRFFMPQRDEAVIRQIKGVCREMKAPKIAVFSPSVEHARRFACRLNEAGLTAGYVSSKNKPLAHKTLLDFSSDKLVAITAVDMLNEGIDVPDINIVVFLRATHSRRIFVQQLGRGLRVSKTKSKVIVLDFVSDIRRLAAVVEMNDEAKRGPKPGEYAVVYLKNGFVTFSNNMAKGFVEEWLKESTDIQDGDDNATLAIPAFKDCEK